MAGWDFDLLFIPREWSETHRHEELINEEGMSDARFAWLPRAAT
jgi:hypothetical protein